jgi:hypothetical protein
MRSGKSNRFSQTVGTLQIVVFCATIILSLSKIRQISRKYVRLWSLPGLASGFFDNLRHRWKLAALWSASTVAGIRTNGYSLRDASVQQIAL